MNERKQSNVFTYIQKRTVGLTEQIPGWGNINSYNKEDEEEDDDDDDDDDVLASQIG